MLVHYKQNRIIEKLWFSFIFRVTFPVYYNVPIFIEYLPDKHHPYELTIKFLLCCYLAFLVHHSETSLQGVSKFVLKQNSVLLGTAKWQLMLFHTKGSWELVSFFCHPLFPLSRLLASIILPYSWQQWKKRKTCPSKKVLTFFL